MANKHVNKRILNLPPDELVINSYGDLEYPEVLVDCRDFKYCRCCSECMLALSTKISREKWHELYRKGKEGEYKNIVYTGCNWWNSKQKMPKPPYPLPPGIILKFDDEDIIYKSTEYMTPRLYRTFLPFILDLYEFGRKKNSEDTGR